MYGSCLNQALYKFSTLFLASDLSTDSIGFTCFTVALTLCEAILNAKYTTLWDKRQNLLTYG